MSKRKTTEEFIADAIKVHGGRYDYSKVVYVGRKTKVCIICSEHGEFWQTPDNHLSGYNCQQCSDLACSATKVARIKTTLISRFESVHGNRYDYSGVVYTTAHTKVPITCKEHGIFWQSPSNHIQGTGCPSCQKNGFNQDKEAILYYIVVTPPFGSKLWKIGITNRTVGARFTIAELQFITIIWTIHYKKGADAYKEEQKIIKKFAHLRYKGEPILANGNTELFTEDILAGYQGIDLV
jgi:hypothetical protein